MIPVTSREPVQALYQELKRSKDKWEKNGIQAIYRIADCHTPRQISNATFDGHRLAREFDSPHPQYPLPWIRERQLWGAETVPKPGDARPQVEVGSWSSTPSPCPDACLCRGFSSPPL
ncbi:hypothetical protein AGMMS49545_16520 [Betaproteobacteria bacterium]|nr:hypothetical protein AGMMS49545_16520 [Betaproteobacteria bacterium]GHU46324.1 hypothetical protein AGMMS50289_19470 [Betaproteobacteria bacterium]